MPKEETPPLNLSLRYLREGEGVKQKALAARLGWSESAVIDLEKGRTEAKAELVGQVLAALGLKPEAVGWMAEAVRKVRARGRRQSGAPSPEGEGRDLIERLIAGTVDSFENTLRTGVGGLFRNIDLIEGQRQAPFLWRRLRRHPHNRRLLLVREDDEFHNWALCVGVTEESLKAATDDAAKALELAELAVEIARHVPGDETWRWRIEGWGRFHLGNAVRVANGLRKSEEEFVRARKLWTDGAPSDPGLLNAARILSLEASLLRDRRRLPEALDVLREALEIDRWGETPNLLINLVKTLEEAGEFDAALAALRRAKPYIDRSGDPWLRFGLHMNTAVLLGLLEKTAEAAPLLPEIRALAERLNNQLDLTRVRWLEGRVAAGFGHEAEALAAFEEARQIFSARCLPYDVALVNLDLALLHLQRGRTAEVQELAAQMLQIFPAQGVYRETLAALRLFWSASESGTVTTELVQALLRYVHRARHDPELRFEPLRADAGTGKAGADHHPGPQTE